MKIWNKIRESFKSFFLDCFKLKEGISVSDYWTGVAISVVLMVIGELISPWVGLVIEVIGGVLILLASIRRYRAAGLNPAVHVSLILIVISGLFLLLAAYGAYVLLGGAWAVPVGVLAAAVLFALVFNFVLASKKESA